MIVILGGGISGLAAAFKLKQQGKEFVLIETSDRLGGKIYSKQAQGYTFELGPNTVLINNAETKELLAELGLLDKIIQPEEEAVKSRFVLKNGKVEAIPNSFGSAFKSNLFSLSTLYHILKEPLVKASKSTSEESLASFSRRRFGEQIYEDFITPFITGIYAGDPEKMSVNHTLSILKEAEDKHGSVVKGMMEIMKEKKAKNEAAQLPKQKIFSFSNGLKGLIDALENYLGDAIIKNASVESLVFEGKKIISVEYHHQGKKVSQSASQLISTLPASVFAKLVKTEKPALANSLNEINYVPAVVVHLGVDKQLIDFKAAAFGLLSRKDEKVPFLGVLFNSRFFPHQAPKGKDLITIICGGYRQPKMIEKPEDDILKEITQSLQAIIGLKGELEFSHVTKWETGIPQYELGYADIKSEIEAFLKEYQNIYLAGNYFGGISVSDCIANGFKMASLATT